jgi:hypothetical protein
MAISRRKVATLWQKKRKVDSSDDEGTTDYQNQRRLK